MSVSVISSILGSKKSYKDSNASNVNMNELPLPYIELTLISPLKFSTKVLQMLRPSPIPLVLILEVELSLPNNLNNFRWSSWDIPTPLSSTITSNFFN